MSAVVGVADPTWIVRHVSVDEEQLLTCPPLHLVGTSLLAQLQEDDAAHVELAFTNAQRDGRSLTAEVNVGRYGRWHRARVILSPMRAGQPGIGFAIHRMPDDDTERATRLEGHLLRIGEELHAARIASAPPIVTDGVAAFLSTQPLSARQSEIIQRLMQGERVPGIARSLFLSASTVRNHLTATFAKFGVHSQEALIATIRERAASLPPTT